jgi:hypothetical protein
MKISSITEMRQIKVREAGDTEFYRVEGVLSLSVSFYRELLPKFCVHEQFEGVVAPTPTQVGVVLTLILKCHI